VTTNGCFPSKTTKIPSLSWRRDDRFSAQNGKDDPNPRAARAWQKNSDKRKYVKEIAKQSRYMYSVDSIGWLPSIGRALFIRCWTLRTGKEFQKLEPTLVLP
jgi:hypothetical protein